jgi:hypothetical protein
LPETIDVDPGIEAHLVSKEMMDWTAKQKADSTRLWAKYFAPVSASGALAQVQDPETTTQHEWAFTPENNNIGRQLKSSASTSMMYMKRKRAKAPMVVSEVRRSKRLKGKSVGYKAESCVSRTCFCCSIDPPTLSPKVIRSLGVDFCKMSPKVTSDEALKSKPVGKKKAICRVAKVPKASKNKKCEDEDKTKEKCRKN